MAFLHSFLVILLFPLTSAQSDCTVNLGSEMTAGDNTNPWVSRTREFAFGFLPAQGQTNRFLLAIWFDKITEQMTIVWYLKHAFAPFPKGSKIQLTKEGHFVLLDDKGHEIWSPTTTISQLVRNNSISACAAMLDSGNFVLMDKDSSYVWESFDFPTDTLLPGQRIRPHGYIASRPSETEYSDGRFRLSMQEDGNLVLSTVFLPTGAQNSIYWESKTNGPNLELVFDNVTGHVCIKEGTKVVYNVTTEDLGSNQDAYRMARIDTVGVFRLYRRPKTSYAADARGWSSTWETVHTIPENVCNDITSEMGSGACGFNSYCEIVDGRPQCLCPEGFSALNTLNNHGCAPDFSAPSCRKDGWESKRDLIEFKELNNTNWPLSDYEVQKRADMNKSLCEELCLEDCFCAAAVYNMDDSCFKKRFPLSNGRKYKGLIGMTLIKVPKNNNETALCPLGCSKDRSTLVTIISVLLGSSGFLNLLLLAAISFSILFVRRNKLLNLLSNTRVHGVIRRYTYKELEEATEGFKDQLGRGSFGTVYKGILTSIPNRYIAVKRLDSVQTEGEREFMTEVATIGRTHHKNLVTLLGYCNEGSHRLLVYEYMSSGSLASFLFGLSRPHWNQRMQIAFGIARGLMYLHEECSTQIIHCDVKPQNILLDDYLVPKISDFGLAKLLLSQQSRAPRTHIRGTVGYFAPEWLRKASVTVKIDVYSFGVMLLEMICCMSSVAFGMQDQDDAALVDWVYDCYSKRQLDRLVENDEEALNDMKGVERAVMVGIWCIQEDPSLRPSMRRVTQMLEGVAKVSVPPRPSVFSSN